MRHFSKINTHFGATHARRDARLGYRSLSEAILALDCRGGEPVTHQQAPMRLRYPGLATILPQEGFRRVTTDERIELVLANGSKFPHTGKIGAIEADFNKETGNIPFRADVPNPDRLLRHGQTGNVVISRTLSGAIVIPQRATFEILDKRYVYLVGEDHIVRQREIVFNTN